MSTRIAPELFVRRGSAAVEFYAAAFGAVVDHRVGDGDDIVAQLSVGEATFWVHAESPALGNASPESLGGCTVRTLLIVDDPDSVFARALAAGAEEISAVDDEHGWRVGRLRDPFGHQWEIGRPLGAWPPDH
jgi:PhnB protein